MNTAGSLLVTHAIISRVCPTCAVSFASEISRCRIEELPPSLRIAEGSAIIGSIVLCDWARGMPLLRHRDKTLMTSDEAAECRTEYEGVSVPKIEMCPSYSVSEVFELEVAARAVWEEEQYEEAGTEQTMQLFVWLVLDAILPRLSVHERNELVGRDGDVRASTCGSFRTKMSAQRRDGNVLDMLMYHVFFDRWTKSYLLDLLDFCGLLLTFNSFVGSFYSGSLGGSSQN